MILGFTTHQYVKARSICAVPALICVSLLVGCSSIGIPDKIKLPKISMPDVPANDPSFRPRVYAGMSVGRSSLKPDTAGTVFTVDESGAAASQFRLGMDLHNKLSVELDTGVLGSATFAQAGTDVSYTSATVSALIYGLTGVKNRSRREGWSGYGRLGYSLVQRASQVLPFDTSDSSVLVGFGAEYGFRNGMALRAELTRFDSEANVLGIGGVYRFGLAPKAIGQVFVKAAKPALRSGNTVVDERGRPHSTTSQQIAGSSAQAGGPPALGAARKWSSTPSKHDIDGDGVKNDFDVCPNTAAQTTVGSTGCGLFDAVLTEVIFKPGSHWLTPRARGALDALSDTLLAFPEARVQVRAHTDSDGPADLNMSLSVRRAEAVVEYLTGLGINELQLEPNGLGEAQPLDSNETKDGKKRNRRVELVTLPNLQAQISGNEVDLAEVNLTNAPGTATMADKNTASIIASASAPAKRPEQPVFPAMSGVKIKPLPKSAYVVGSTLGGIVPGVKFVAQSSRLSDLGRQALGPVQQELERFARVRVAIMAHTDDTGNANAELSLSKERARAVINHLVGLGIDPARLEAEGYGSTLPLAQNVTEADRARNRRVELRILP